MKHQHPQRGFSLFEMTAVLVVIGLMVGGVLIARDMISTSEVKSFITDKDKYLTAANNFKVKYMGLPGDLKNATKYWGVQSGMPGCANDASFDKKTCDGNGDGRVHAIANSNPLYAFEEYRFWQHLSNAGMISGTNTKAAMIEGSFIGIDEDGDSTALSPFTYSPGVNVPAASREGLYFRIRQFGAELGVDPYHFAGGGLSVYGNYLSLARVGCDYCGVMAHEAYTIDKKIDDGSPAFGKVRNFKRSVDNLCTTSAVANTAAYDTDSEEQCIVHFLTDL